MLRFIAVILLSVACAGAQTGTSAHNVPDAQQLAAQFGPAFKPVEGIAVLTADLDGDGKEDAVVVATAANPLLDEAEFHYKVIDPYHAYFGFGDPKMTSTFFAQEQRPRLLLVVQNWRGPQQKFVVINLPFDKLSLGRLLVKKKPIPAIQAEEMTGMKSCLYWDGKKWRWQEETTP